jgi:hypothetical protein
MAPSCSATAPSRFTAASASALSLFISFITANAATCLFQSTVSFKPAHAVAHTPFSPFQAGFVTSADLKKIALG